MLLLALVGCIRLEEGAYAFDYAPVAVDSCDLYQGGQVAEDAPGVLAWDDTVLRFTFDGDADALEFEVNGTAFGRAVADEVPLDDAGTCWLAVEEEDVGEMVSNTVFQGHTAWVGVLQGDCGVFDALFDDPCEVEFDWRGERD